LGITPDYDPSNPDDTGPFRQSERAQFYDEALKLLLDSGKAYKC
jgi:glutamyl/glutaminyl-tRNA synthetase